MIKRTSTLIFTALIIAITGTSVFAQKAPEYSNDFLMDNKTMVFFMADRFEYNINSGLNPLVLDAQGYIGRDINKFWLEAEGETIFTEKEGEVELEALYGRAISPYFDLRAGLRYDIAYTANNNQTRAFAVLGIQGLAPYLFEVDGNLFISEDGDISAQLEAEYDLPITQRLWAQPRLETSIAVQEVPQWGTGNGFNDIQLGFRLRYEIEREFAPYIGFSWNRKVGETADYARTGGDDVSTFGMVGGLRMWF
ncbi:MAG: copper resistance protein B [Balneolaceae bacterium]|nr:copper resistance protein B [Balneolaceae bacterium]